MYKTKTGVVTVGDKKIRVDKCMVYLIRHINEYMPCVTLGCCSGHGIYPMTIVVQENKGLRFELLSNITIPRTKRFYKKDKEGYYYIPEVINDGYEMDKNNRNRN